MKLEELTWQDVSRLSAETLVMIPTGSIRQHGPHLPLCTNSLIVEKFAEFVESKLSHSVLLAPTMKVGASSSHLGFPGTLSNSIEGYMAQVESIISSLALHGFFKFLLLNSHSGNEAPNKTALRKVKDKFPNFILYHMNYYSLASHFSEDVSESFQNRSQASLVGELETSLMLYLKPELVKMDLAIPDGLLPENGLQPEELILNMDEVTQTGSFGLVHLATKEKGEKLFHQISEVVLLRAQELSKGLFYSERYHESD